MRKFALITLVGVCLILPTMAFSQSVAQVNTVEVPAAKAAEYVAAVKALKPLIKKHSPGATMRVWQATIAGPMSNRISVVVEFSSMTAWAEGMTKLQADPEFAKALAKFAALGRKIVSVQVATEM